MNLKKFNLQLVLTYFSFVFLILSIVACNKDKKNENDTNSSSSSKQEEKKKEIRTPASVIKKIAVSCGDNSAEVELKIIDDKNEDWESFEHNKYLLALAPSPGTAFFEEAYGDYTKDLIKRLANDQRYRVIQVRYPSRPVNCGHAGQADGFYALCCQQGMESVIKHNEELYTKAMEAVKFQENPHPDKVLDGIGFSLGTVQWAMMAFNSNKFVKNLAFVAPVAGKGSAGCHMLKAITYWKPELVNNFFGNLSDSLTLSSQGCTQGGYEDTSMLSYNYNGKVPLEFTEKYDFENLPHRNSDVRLGIFDGADFMPQKLIITFLHLSRDPAFDQFRYNHHLMIPAQNIYHHRDKSRTSLKLYNGCGHGVWHCDEGRNNLNDDILHFFDSN